jgi:predicted amidohydrolase
MLFYQEVPPEKTTFVLAMGQMRVVGGEPATNLARAAEVIAEAAQFGADLVLLPEALDLGWSHPSAAELATTIPDGSSCSQLADCAREHGVWICAGLVERDAKRIYNCAVLIDRGGEVVLKHRKINELDFAREVYATGSATSVADTEFGRLGLMICADAFIEGHTISRALGAQGAKIILSPCAWAVPDDHDDESDPYGQLWIDSYSPVAREFSLWIAGVSNVGRIAAGAWAGRRCIGCSLLIDRVGDIAKRAPYGIDAETVLYADIEIPPSAAPQSSLCSDPI